MIVPGGMCISTSSGEGVTPEGLVRGTLMWRSRGVSEIAAQLATS